MASSTILRTGTGRFAGNVLDRIEGQRISPRSTRGRQANAFAQALRASTTHRYDYLHAYVDDLENVIDMAAIRDAKIALGVDPLGGAGVDYWPRIAERYGSI